MALVIWCGALLVYLGFRLWYDGLKKPLTPAEVERLMDLIGQQTQPELSSQDQSTLRQFMEQDDGKEFIMVNLIQFMPSPIEHPDTGQPVSANALVQEYFKPFMSKVVRRAGHPVLVTRALSGYLEAWNTPADPGWHAAGLIRYRSRRDCILLSLANPDFAAIHKYKIAALRQTFAFPSARQAGLYASPRLTVALVVALTAALLQLALV